MKFTIYFHNERYAEAEEILMNVYYKYEYNEIKKKITFYFANSQKSFPCTADNRPQFGEVVFKNKNYYCGLYDYYYFERDRIEFDNEPKLINLIKTEIIQANTTNKLKVKLDEDIIIPLMVKNNYQEVTIKINNEINKIKNLLRNRFYYYRFHKNDKLEIKSKDKFILGNGIKVKKDKKIPSLILNIFIDGLAQTFIEKNNIENTVPNIYKFFKEGTICNNTYTTGEWTYVSLASFFTGKTTTNHRVFHPNYDTNNLTRNELYNEIFQNNGYLTTKIDGDWRSNPAIGYMKGLDRYLYQPSVRDMHCDDVITETIEHLETFKDNNNFLWICIPDLHDVADEFETRISTQVKSSIRCRSFDKSGETSVRKKKDDKKFERFGIQLKRIDTYLGLLFNYIKDNYNEDDFIVNLVADHGQGYLINSDEFLDEERTKIAMMFRGKNIPKGQCNEFIAGLDLFPIILNSIDKKDFNMKDGNIPKYFGGDKNREYVYSETIFPGSPYQATINDKIHKFFFKSKDLCTIDGRIKLDSYEISLINKITGKEESKENVDKILKYTDEVFNHMREYIII